MMTLKIQDLIDIEQFQILQDRLNEIYSFPSAIIDNDGKVLTATAWQDICTKFHRQNSECEKECIKSDRYIADHLHEANPAVSYRCPHGLIDNATPIIIEGVHYANYFTGQFFLEPPDLNFFRAQAKRYGFDEEAYIEAVKKVPIWTQEQLNSYLFFIKGLIEVIASTGLKNLKEIEAKKKMEESEENASTVLRQIQEGFWITIPQGGQIIDVNEAMCSMLGYTRDQMLKMSVGDVEANDSQEAIERTIQHVIQAGSAHFESRFRRKDNTIIDVDVSITYLPNRNLFFGFHRDITERKQADEVLRQSQETAERQAEETAVLAEIGKVIGSTLDIEEVYERFAAEAKKLIPFDRIAVYLHSLHEETVTVAYVSGEEISGRHRGDSFPLKNSISDVIIKTREALLDYPKTIEELHKKFHDHDTPGRDAVMPSLARVPLIYRNEVIGILHFGSKTPNVYTLEDLHLAERIGTQIAGAIGNAQLFNDLRKTEKSLRESEERLQRAEKMEALGQLAGGVAHDLNNVLGIMSGYSELLMDEIPEGNPSRNHVEKILKSTKKGAAIIDDLLTLARRGVTATDVINMNVIVSDFLTTPAFENIRGNNPRVTFKTERDENLLNIKGSPVHLEKTLMNLVSNAAEAISSEGEVIIRTENRYLEKLVKGYDEIQEGEYAVLTVSDTGTGIPTESLEKIFEPFYTKKKMGRSGTGLGLSIVWGTVKDHNGYIDLQTEEGEGTTFKLYFPVTREELTSPEADVPIEQYMGQGESVLVVDDIAEQREIASKLLTKLGYEVHLVSSGEEAVEYLKGNKADILVLDMIMTPGIDGLETYRRVLEINPKQKAIIVSGFSETDRTDEARKLGAGAYVKKPYVLGKIGVAIREELNR